MTLLNLRNPSAFADCASAEFGTFAEAARVMLARFHETPPPNTSGAWTHDGGTAQVVEFDWEAPSHDDQRAHANEIDATEDAGYAVAMAIADQLGFIVIGRLHHGSGADWWLRPRGEPENDRYKLEVSGIARTSASNTPAARLQAKVKQGLGGDLSRPGLAVVVRFEDASVLSESWR